jgi:trans-aconitate methyltransferase
MMQLNDHDYERLLNYYRQALFQYGENDPRSVHWVTDFNQYERFQILLQVGNLNNATILDVGCGMGDFFPLLRQHFNNFIYTGIDIVPDFIDIAKERFPEATFLKTNILDLPEKKKFDYVFASGALSFKVKDNKNYYQEIIKKMFLLSNKTTAFNMLDNSCHIDDDTYAAYNQNDIMDFCKTLTSKVEILTGYLPQDFTVIMSKEN